MEIREHGLVRQNYFMKNYDDQRISFPVPEGWLVRQDESDNILYNDPSDSETWCFVQLGGLRPKAPDEPLPSARNALSGCYEKELAINAATITNLGESRAFIEWPEITKPDGREFVVYHFHWASSTTSGEIQLADFSLAVPSAIKDTPKVSRLKELVREQIRVAKFHEWQ
jgi:hypothetical protein